MLTIGTSAAVLAAPPGSPFYNARVYIETLTLPSQVDARLAGHERLLQERIAEAEAAAARSDAIGLAAALAAYQAEVNAASVDVGDDAARLAHLEDMLAKHTTTLTALAAELPEDTSIEHAIDASSKAIANLKAKASHPHQTHAPGGPQGQQQGQQR
jgi:chromosome segregation ATPase